MRARYQSAGSQMRVRDITHSCTRLHAGPTRRGAPVPPPPSLPLPPPRSQPASPPPTFSPSPSPSLPFHGVLSLPLCSRTNEIVRPCGRFRYRAGRSARQLAPGSENPARLAEPCRGGRCPPWKRGWPRRGLHYGEDAIYFSVLASGATRTARPARSINHERTAARPGPGTAGSASVCVN